MLGILLHSTKEFEHSLRKLYIYSLCNLTNDDVLQNVESIILKRSFNFIELTADLQQAEYFIMRFIYLNQFE